jgi:hypothetical protein
MESPGVVGILAGALQPPSTMKFFELANHAVPCWPYAAAAGDVLRWRSLSLFAPATARSSPG